jgi:hypothetical protein
MVHPNDRYRAAVQLNLRTVRRRHEEVVRLDRTPIKAAFGYGWTVPEIAIETNLPVHYIRHVLLDQ